VSAPACSQVRLAVPHHWHGPDPQTVTERVAALNPGHDSRGWSGFRPQIASRTVPIYAKS